MTLLSTWTQFQLFDYTPVRDPAFQSDDPLFSDPSLSAISATKTYLIIAVNNCELKIIDPQTYTKLGQFQAYDSDYRITFIKPLRNSGNLVVTLAEKQGFPLIIKLWDITKILNIASLEYSEYKFKFQTQVSVYNHASGTGGGSQDNSFPVSCFVFNFDLTCLAVGYTDGKVILIRGDLLRDRGSKQRVVYESGSDPITNLQIDESDQILYVTTTSKVITVATTGRNQGKPLNILSRKQGAALGCCELLQQQETQETNETHETHETQETQETQESRRTRKTLEISEKHQHQRNEELLVALEDSITQYNAERKVKTIPLHIFKSRIIALGQHVFMVCPEEDGKGLKTRIIAVDLRNFHISLNLLLNDIAVKAIFKLDNKHVFILTNDGVLYKVFEKPANQQIEIIVQRGLFSVAFTLAKQLQLPTSTLLRIQNLHADHLYNDQYYEEAIDIYIKCLELLEEEKKKNETNKNIQGRTERAQRSEERHGERGMGGYIMKRTDKGDDDKDDDAMSEFIMGVITKYKDASNMKSLVKFLQRLYNKNIADIDHITLLLCCLCKLQRTDELDHFIENLDLSIENLQNLNFQLIINLFKECGFYTQVLKLLHKLQQSKLIVDLQLNELKSPKLALKYMKTLTIDDLLLILIDHTKALLDNCPVETTELLIDVFTGKYKACDPEEPAKSISNNSDKNGDTALEKESSVEPSNYQSFLSYLSLIRPETREDDQEFLSSSTSANRQQNAEPTYLPPKPNLIFSSFTESHNYEFVIFLEACIEAYDKFQGSITDKKEVLLTLFEVYLSLNSTTGESEWFNKAEVLLEQYKHLLDDESVLLLSHLFKFSPGEVSVKEGNNDEEGLFATYQMKEDVAGCFRILQKHGERKPQLYKTMLEFVISKQSVFEKVSDGDIQTLIKQVRHYKLVDPMELLDLLTNGDEPREFLTFGIVKDYYMELFNNQQQEISNNEKLIEMYEQESVKNSLKVSELTSRPFIIQNNKCSLCKAKLDFPMVHFKCKHSFHQKCLSTSLIAHGSSNSYSGHNGHGIGESSHKSVYARDDDDSKSKCPLCLQSLDEMKYVKGSQYKLKEQYEPFINSLHESTDKFRYIADSIGKGVMENESITID